MLHGATLGMRTFQQLLYNPKNSQVELANVDLNIREAAFVESMDLFACLIHQDNARHRLILALAAIWGLPGDQYLQQYETLHRPLLEEGETVRIGRVSLPRLRDDPALSSGKLSSLQTVGQARGSGSTFSTTGHALRLMERVAACLALDEPVLLVGETGTGKTTLLSRIASYTGALLVPFNLSQQTDSSDLLGGFKPIDAQDTLLPLLGPFLDLVRRTYRK